MVYVHANVLLMHRKINLKSQGLLLVNILGQVDNKKVGNPCTRRLTYGQKRQLDDVLG